MCIESDVMSARNLIRELSVLAGHCRGCLRNICRNARNLFRVTLAPARKRNGDPHRYSRSEKSLDPSLGRRGRRSPP
jgi:hypothetical protein